MRVGSTKYTIACVCNTYYIDVAIVSLESFFKYNDIHVDIYMINSEKTNRFDRFENVTVNYVYFAIEPSLYAKSVYRNHLEEICFKLKIMDEVKSEYVLVFDIDTLFVGSIAPLLKDYNTTLCAVRHTLFDGVNAGLMIYKTSNRNDTRLFDEFLINAYNGIEYINLEEEFLYKKFIGDITFLDGAYNCSEILPEPTIDVVMYHYLGEFKPFKRTNKIDPSKCLIKYFDKYYDFVKDVNELSKEFRDCVFSTHIYYKMLFNVKYKRGIYDRGIS